MTAPLDLAGIGRWASRPGVEPAPKPVTQPKPTGDNPLPSRIGPTVSEKACGCGVLASEDCDCQEFAAQARTAARRPIFFDFRKAVA